MKRWSIGINSYHKTAHVVLEELPLYVSLIEKANDRFCGFINSYLAISFPNIFPKKRDPIEDCVCKNLEIKCDNHDKLYTLKEWYGDLGQFWCGHVCQNIFGWCWSKTKCTSLDITYDKCKELFYEDNKEYFDEQEKQAEEMRKEDEKSV